MEVLGLYCSVVPRSGVAVEGSYGWPGGGGGVVWVHWPGAVVGVDRRESGRGMMWADRWVEGRGGHILMVSHCHWQLSRLKERRQCGVVSGTGWPPPKQGGCHSGGWAGDARGVRDQAGGCCWVVAETSHCFLLVGLWNICKVCPKVD